MYALNREKRFYVVNGGIEIYRYGPFTVLGPKQNAGQRLVSASCFRCCSFVGKAAYAAR